MNDSDLRQQRAELAAKRCSTCNENRRGTPLEPKPCIECGTPWTSYSCAPGYCSTCAHDPRWVLLADLDAGRVVEWSPPEWGYTR